MANSLNDVIVLNNGVKMPWVGLGVWKVTDNNELINAVQTALKVGYRNIDTAAAYGNEEGVGEAIKTCGLPREELFITTKVWNRDQGYESTLNAFETSRKKLGLEYLDLYLIHWPVKEKYVDTWKAMEKLYKEGLIRAIGVCNFHVHHLENLLNNSSIVPAVDQVELHPLLSQRELRDFTKSKGIQIEAWSPLMQGNLDNPVLTELGKKYGKSPAQIILRWDLQNGVVIIPKSVHENRIKENSDIFDFQLSSEDMGKIETINQNRRFGSDPDNFNF